MRSLDCISFYLRLNVLSFSFQDCQYPRDPLHFNVNAVRCRPSTFATIWISAGWTSTINFRCLLPLDLPGKTSGSIFFLPSSVRTPLWKEATLEKTFKDVKRKWEAKKLYFLNYKKDGTRPSCIDLTMALHGFGIDNIAAQNAIEGSKALHARASVKAVTTVTRNLHPWQLAIWIIPLRSLGPGGV